MGRPRMHWRVSARCAHRDVQPAPVLRRVAVVDALRQLRCRVEDAVERTLGMRLEVVFLQTSRASAGVRLVRFAFGLKAKSQTKP